ncbi:MAG: hypothetical protein LBT46_11670 [Planctomycetaceae bacterium]|nr:hypothetical protein [Planctomycetaceae bacterium]
MMNNTNWLPGKREAQLAMVGNWTFVIGNTNPPPWGIPATDVSDLQNLYGEAITALQTAQNTEQRTPFVTAQCKAAFEALTAKMRYIKSRYFLTPPLTDPDLVSLELKPKDTTHTPIPVPVNQPGIEMTKWAPHTLGFRRFTATNLGGGESDYGIRVYYALVAPGAITTTEKPSATRLAAEVYILSAPPQTPADLPNSFFTRRYNDLLELPPEASGKTCYLAARFENSKGQSGPWGTMIQAVIP